MSESDRFESRFNQAYRRYLDEAPIEVDALEVARTAATQRRFTLSWPRIVGPTRALLWVLLLALLLAALAASTLFIGSQPPAVVSSTEVTGTSVCNKAHPGQWTGAYVLGGATERLSETTQECTMEASDPRLTGEVENVVDCNYADVDGVLVGECWGTSVLRNEDGAWAGVFAGTTRDEPGPRIRWSWSTSGVATTPGVASSGASPPTRPRASSPGRSSRSSEPCRMPTATGS